MRRIERLQSGGIDPFQYHVGIGELKTPGRSEKPPKTLAQPAGIVSRYYDGIESDWGTHPFCGEAAGAR